MVDRKRAARLEVIRNMSFFLMLSLLSLNNKQAGILLRVVYAKIMQTLGLSHCPVMIIITMVKWVYFEDVAQCGRKLNP